MRYLIIFALGMTIGYSWNWWGYQQDLNDFWRANHYTRIEATKQISWCYGQMSLMVEQTKETVDQLEDVLEETYPEIKKKLDKIQ